MKKTFYLFGQEAVRIYEEEGFDEIKPETVDTVSIFCFTKGVTEANELLLAMDGFLAFCEISEGEFFTLMGRFPDADLTPKTNNLISKIVDKFSVLASLVEIRENLIKHDALSRDGERNKSCTLLRQWVEKLREELEIPWSELGEKIVEYFGLHRDAIYPSSRKVFVRYDKEAKVIIDSHENVIVNLDKIGIDRKGSNYYFSLELMEQVIYKWNYEGVSKWEIQEFLLEGDCTTEAMESFGEQI